MTVMTAGSKCGGGVCSKGTNVWQQQQQQHGLLVLLPPF
jgi:hypothetical protein